jgi:hypothetical protein
MIYNRLIYYVSKYKQKRFTKSQNEYLIRLHYTFTWIKQHSGNYEDRSENIVEKNQSLTVISLFLLLPVIFNLHHFIPEGITEFHIGSFRISNHGFKSVDIFLWLLKVTYLLGLSIWFVTSSNWWKYAILSPIILTAYQLWEMCQDVRYIDAWGNLRALPFILLVVGILIFISGYVKYEYKVSDLRESLQKEMDELLQSKANLQQFEGLKKRIAQLKIMLQAESPLAEKHLETLQQIREELMKEMEVKM